MYSCEGLSPLALADGSAYGPDLMRIIDSGYDPNTDRRSRARLRLSWTIYLLRSTGVCPLESRTVNISSGGFYCLTREPFMIGEYIQCTIMIPSFGSERRNGHIGLRCQATVLRVDVLEEVKFGIACRIDDYTLAIPTEKYI
jgi:hypothetical protein